MWQFFLSVAMIIGGAMLAIAMARVLRQSERTTDGERAGPLALAGAVIGALVLSGLAIAVGIATDLRLGVLFLMAISGLLLRKAQVNNPS